MVSRYLLERFDLTVQDVLVTHHDPEDFVVRFRRRVDRDRVLAAPAMGALLALVWRPWKRTSMASRGSLRYSVLVGMTQIPLHARSATTAQIILSPSCAEVNIVRPERVPDDDDWEFFILAWCLHPQFIPDEKIIFIPEPQIPNPVEGALEELPGLCYLVRIRLVAFQDCYPPSPPLVARGPGHEDDDDGSPDSNINRYHPGLDDGPSHGSPTNFGEPSDDGEGSGDSNCNRFHPGMDYCRGGSTPGVRPGHLPRWLQSTRVADRWAHGWVAEVIGCRLRSLPAAGRLPPGHWAWG